MAGVGHEAKDSGPRPKGRCRVQGNRRTLDFAVNSQGFWTWQLVVAMLLNSVFQALTVAAYASRLAAARSGRVATAISLFNMFATSSRFAQMLYTPLLGSLSDRAVGLDTTTFQWQLRSIVFAGTAGVVLGTLAIPTFVMLYLRAIRSLEYRGSVLKSMFHAMRPAALLRMFGDIKLRVVDPISTISFRAVPKDILILNTLVTAVYGIGIVAAAYASVLDPHAARTAVLSSGLVNGIATIAYNVVVDPQSAIITDRTVRGGRPIEDVKGLVAGLSLTAILGFLLSQFLLLPGAALIAYVAHTINGR